MESSKPSKPTFDPEHNPEHEKMVGQMLCGAQAGLSKAIAMSIEEGLSEYEVDVPFIEHVLHTNLAMAELVGRNGHNLEEMIEDMREMRAADVEKQASKQAWRWN